MKVVARCLLLCGLVFVGFFGYGPLHVQGAAIWRSTTNGFWRDGTNWNGGQPPNLGLGGAYLTNGTTKTVTVDALTATTNLFINSLNIWAPPNSTNTLLLSDLGADRPLVVSNSTLTVAGRGQIVVTNSSLVVTGRFINFNVWAGNLTLESGSIICREEPLTTNVTVITRIGRTNVATLTLNGGVMQATDLYLGESPGSQFSRSTGKLKMTGGLLSVAGEFSIGKDTGCTGAVEVAGGQIAVANNLTNITRIGDQGIGSLVVSNSALALADVSVGRHDGARGTLVLQPTGFIGTSDDFSIGRFSGGTGAVFVAGGELVVTNHPIWVGREGVGQLIISNGLISAQAIRVATISTNTSHGSVTLAGGLTLLSSNLMVGADSIATGQVVMAGGTLLVSNADSSGFLDLTAGTFTMNYGQVTADFLSATNTRGSFIFNGGTVQSKGTLVSNGLPFVVGNGITAATFNLQGGTHVFANGLVISSNAMLTGCGSIVGSVVNHGTIATNCTTTPPVITQGPISQTITQGATLTLTIAATGTAPLSYQWLFGAPGLEPGNLLNAINTSLVITNAAASNAGNYSAIVSNAFGSKTSVVATVRVLVPPGLTNIIFTANVPSFSFQSVSGLNYTIEYKDNLAASGWILLAVRVGNGSLLTVSDPDPSPTMRFYRIRVE